MIDPFCAPRVLSGRQLAAPAQAGSGLHLPLSADERTRLRGLRHCATEPLALLRAAYHLGNRHVALEVRPGELRLLDDPVLADLLVQRGLELERRHEPFLPEGGAYAAHHGHSHSHHPHVP